MFLYCSEKQVFFVCSINQLVSMTDRQILYCAIGSASLIHLMLFFFFKESVVLTKIIYVESENDKKYAQHEELLLLR